jgi:hypothetical protein
MFSKIPDREIQRPGILVARKIRQVALAGCTNDWHNRRSSRKLILRIPPSITIIHLGVYSVTFQVCKAYRFNMQVHRKWEMCKTELYTIENIPVV